MSPHRRQTRGSLSTDTQAVSKQSAFIDAGSACRTRSGLRNVAKSPSPSKAIKSPKKSPSKQQSTPVRQALSPRKSLFKASTPQRSPKTPQKSPKKSPIKNVSNVKGYQTGKKVLESPQSTAENKLKSKVVVKKEPQSPSKALVGEKNLKTKVAIKKEPQSPSKTPIPEDKNVKTTPKRPDSKLLSLNDSESSPTQLRVTRGSSVGKSPLSANHSALKSSPLKYFNKASSSPLKQSSDGLKSQSPSSRKRSLPPPTASPQSAKTRRLRGKVLISMQTNDAADSEQDSVILDGVKKYNLDKSGESNTTVLPLGTQESNPETLSDVDVPELSSRFMRRKWFSLKTRGGFTCLRSAILTPEEIAQEVLQKTMADTPQNIGANFFTTKLMVRLSSKLPPVRARPSCEELVDLINSKQTLKSVDSFPDLKGEGTAIRVKVEKRSFSDTITHVTSKPSKVISKPASPVKPVKPVKSETKVETIVKYGERNLTKKQEREIALRQLKNLRDL